MASPTFSQSRNNLKSKVIGNVKVNFVGMGKHSVDEERQQKGEIEKSEMHVYTYGCPVVRRFSICHKHVPIKKLKELNGPWQTQPACRALPSP